MKELDRMTVCGIARLAGQEIMRVRAAGFGVEYKADSSPVTAADKAANALIREALAHAFPKIPILSEETEQEPFEVRKSWKRFWLVDPLDGTKEFVKDNGEFTVNIALMEKNRPVFGVIQVPVRDVLYFGGKGLGAFKMEAGKAPEPIRTRKPQPGAPLTVLQSRSHPDDRLQTFLDQYPERAMITAGSAMKFCLLAEGGAHLYPRLNPTMEWDVAAGHALLEGAGGAFTDLEGNPFPYNKPSLVNGPFLARA